MRSCFAASFPVEVELAGFEFICSFSCTDPVKGLDLDFEPTADSKPPAYEREVLLGYASCCSFCTLLKRLRGSSWAGYSWLLE